jgi:hypothetical protein
MVATRGSNGYGVRCFEPVVDDCGDRTVPVTVQSGCLEVMRFARPVPTYPIPRIKTCGGAMERHPRSNE